MPSQQEPSLAIVCPMANEADSALALVDEALGRASGYFKNVTFFAILDNVSKDGTRGLLEEHAKTEPRLKVIFAPENRCVVDAYVKGYTVALEAGCDWILEMDAGFSHNPKSIPDFLRVIAREKDVDVVYGTRFSLGGKIVDSSFRRRMISKFGGIVSNLLLGTRMGDMTSGFILYSRAALQQVLAHGVQSRGPFFHVEMKYHARGMRYVEVPIVYSNASHNVGSSVLADARLHLLRLRRQRDGAAASATLSDPCAK